MHNSQFSLMLYVSSTQKSCDHFMTHIKVQMELDIVGWNTFTICRFDFQNSKNTRIDKNVNLFIGDLNA